MPGYAVTVLRFLADVGVLSSAARGVGIQHLGLSRFAAVPFPLPPRSEQERIAAEVSRRMRSLRDAEASLRSALIRIEQQVSTILEAAATGQLIDEANAGRSWESPHPPQHQSAISVGRTREVPELVPEGLVDVTPMPGLPAGWTWTTIATVGETKLGRQRSPKYERGENICPYPSRRERIRGSD